MRGKWTGPRHAPRRMVADGFPHDRLDSLGALSCIQIGRWQFRAAAHFLPQDANQSGNFTLRVAIMLIRLAYDIQFEIPSTVAMVTLLNVHPSRAAGLLEPDELQT